MNTLNDEFLDLKNTALFQEFPDNILQCLSFVSEIIDYDKGEVIFAEHQTSSELYILIQGSVEKYNASQKTKIKKILCLNDICFLSHQANRFSVITKTPVRCIKINENNFIESLKSEPECAIKVIQYLAKKIHDHC